MLIGNVYIVGGGASRIPDVLALLEKEGLRWHGNPDVYVCEYRHFGIDEARELRARSASRALAVTTGQSGARRFFVIAAASMTNEAQNALLKTLEETPGGAVFFLIVPSPHMLLPTVRSRAQMLQLTGHTGEDETRIDAREFLAATLQARLDMLKILLEKGNDEKRDIGAIIAFLSSLERLLAKNVSAQTRAGIRALYRARTYVGDKGALIKPLLEQVALLSPKV